MKNKKQQTEDILNEYAFMLHEYGQFGQIGDSPNKTDEDFRWSDLSIRLDKIKAKDSKFITVLGDKIRLYLKKSCKMPNGDYQWITVNGK